MSAIRPGLPAFPPTPGPASTPDVAGARAGLFRMALNAASALSETNAASAPEPAAAPAETPPDRNSRPGRLLDIRV